MTKSLVIGLVVKDNTVTVRYGKLFNLVHGFAHTPLKVCRVQIHKHLVVDSGSIDAHADVTMLVSNAVSAFCSEQKTGALEIVVHDLVDPGHQCFLVNEVELYGFI